MAFCLNTLLDPGYEPNGLWLQVSYPVGAVLFDINPGDDGCIDELTLIGNHLDYSLAACLLPGTYQFRYEVSAGCFDPAFVEIEIVDSSTQIAAPPTLYVCRDGLEVVGSDHDFQLANGTIVTTLELNDYIAQCDGSPVDYPIDVEVSPTTLTTVLNPITNDSFQLNWDYIDGGVNGAFGFIHTTQSCTTLTIRKTQELGVSCGVEIPVKIIVGPEIEAYPSTLSTCDTVNVYDSIPAGLVTFIDNLTSGPVVPIGGEALFNMSTVGYNGCTSTGQIRIQSSTDNGVTWKNILLTDTVDPLLNPTIQYKVIWLPEDAPLGFDCGGISILTIDTDNCCTPVTDISFLSGGFITDPITCSTADIALLNNSGGALVLEANQDTVWTITNIVGTASIAAFTLTTVEIGLGANGSYSCDGTNRQFRFNITATSCGVAYTEEITIRLAF